MRFRGPIEAIVWEQRQVLRGPFLLAVRCSGLILVIYIQFNLFSAGADEIKDGLLFWLSNIVFFLAVALLGLSEPSSTGSNWSKGTARQKGGDDSSTSRGCWRRERHCLLPIGECKFMMIVLLVRWGAVSVYSLALGWVAWFLCILDPNGGLDQALQLASASSKPFLVAVPYWVVGWAWKHHRATRIAAACILIGGIVLPWISIGGFSLCEWSPRLSGTTVALASIILLCHIEWPSWPSIRGVRLRRVSRRLANLGSAREAQAWYGRCGAGLGEPGTVVAILVGIVFVLGVGAFRQEAPALLDPSVVLSSSTFLWWLIALLLAGLALPSPGLPPWNDRSSGAQGLYVSLMPVSPLARTTDRWIEAAQAVARPVAVLAAGMALAHAAGVLAVVGVGPVPEGAGPLVRGLALFVGSIQPVLFVLAVFVIGLVARLVLCAVLVRAAGMLLGVWCVCWAMSMSPRFPLYTIPAIVASALLFWGVLGALRGRSTVSRNLFAGALLMSCVLLSYAVMSEVTVIMRAVSRFGREAVLGSSYASPFGVPLLVVCVGLSALVCVLLVVAALRRRFPRREVTMPIAVSLWYAIPTLRFVYPDILDGLPILMACLLPLLCSAPVCVAPFVGYLINVRWHDEIEYGLLCARRPHVSDEWKWSLLRALHPFWIDERDG